MGGVCVTIKMLYTSLSSHCEIMKVLVGNKGCLFRTCDKERGGGGGDRENDIEQT